jgi:acyl-coenzyme A thioesterase PaaI-like protein
MGRQISGEYRLGRKLFTGSTDPSGLNLSFELDANRVFTLFDSKHPLAGGGRVIPPGFLLSVVDDLAHATLAALQKRIGVTREARLRFLKPAYAGDGLRADGTLDRAPAGDVVAVQVRVYNTKDQLCLEGEVELFLLSSEQIRRMTPDGMVPLELKRFFVA